MSKNVEIFGGAPEYDERIYMARLETKNQDNKGIGIICKCVMVISKLKKYLI